MTSPLSCVRPHGQRMYMFLGTLEVFCIQILTDIWNSMTFLMYKTSMLHDSKESGVKTENPTNYDEMMELLIGIEKMLMKLSNILAYLCSKKAHASVWSVKFNRYIHR